MDAPQVSIGFKTRSNDMDDLGYPYLINESIDQSVAKKTVLKIITSESCGVGKHDNQQ